MIKVLCLICTSMLLSTNCYAETIQDYEKEKKIVENNITTKEKKIDSLTKDISTMEDKIEKKNNDIVDLKKYTKEKKNLLYQSTTSNFDYLTILEKILNSQNLNQFMNEIKLSKDLIIAKNKTLNNLSQKEIILTKEYDNLLSELNSLNIEKEDTLKEQNELITLKKELEDKIIQMEIELSNKKFNENSNEQIVNLSQKDIHYNSENLLEPSNLNVEILKMLLKGTGLAGLEQDYIDAEKEYGVNALFLVGLSALESGWGTSKRAIYDNNLTGFGVYSDNSIGINDNSKRDNIFRTANCLKKNYLTVGGICYKGLSIKSVNISYCVNMSWADNINRIILNLIKKIK